MKLSSFPRNTFLTAFLSLASMGGSMGSCAMMNNREPPDKPHYRAPEHEAHFCYHSLAQIECFAAPQANMGELVAYDAELIEKKAPVGTDAPAIAPSSPAAAAAAIPNTPPRVVAAPAVVSKKPAVKTTAVKAKPKAAVHRATKPAVTCNCAKTNAPITTKPKTIMPLKEPVPAQEPVTSTAPAAAPSPAGADGAPVPVSNQAPAAPGNPQ